MNFTHYLSGYSFLLLLLHCFAETFSSDKNDYDAYGVKIAMNDHFLVLAQNDYSPPSFFIQFAPYNQTQSSSLSSPSMQCSIAYPVTNNFFVYTVAIGKRQNQSQIHFFFAGEQYTDDQSTPFIGMATFNQASSCNESFTYSLRNLTDYQHQEYYIIAAHLSGRYVYGFSNEFVFILNAQNTSDLNIWSGNKTWNDTTFIPHAVDMSYEFGVVSGFIRNDPNSTVKYSPMIYMIGFNSSNSHQPIVIIYQHIPIATPNTWQALLTNADANYYSAKYDMSVSIDKNGKVLVGMQFINRVFLLSVNMSNPVSMTYISRYTNGRSLGNGKSVRWFDNGIAAVLINVYTMRYEWTSSHIFIFDIYEKVYNTTTTPLSVFPNSRQVLPSSFSSVFLNVVSSSSSLALLDDEGNILIFTPAEPGCYPSVKHADEMPFITSPTNCLAGFFKNKSGIHDCTLCPTGSKNAGDSNTECIPCSSESFCPLGSVADISESALKNMSQVVPYPLSPETTIFDEILLHNMFMIGSSRCLYISPLFWSLVVASLMIVIIIIMEILKLCVEHPRSKTVRNLLKRIFKHTDLIGEGEFWVGGLASFSVVVLVSFAYAFSHEYLKQYPIEKSSASKFSCDETMRNAKFRTNLQSLSIPITDGEKEMFTLLEQQLFTINIDFVNTAIDCDAVSVEILLGAIRSATRWNDCNNTDSILTLSVPLPYQRILVRFILEDTKTIGALRIGLSGPGFVEKNYRLLDLRFYESFYKKGGILSQKPLITLELTKVINETHSMESHQSDFSGIFIPTFAVDMHSLFISNDQYVRSASISTILTVDISETLYYVKNLQQPIARQPEIIFRNLLFTVVCLEIFGLIFLSYRLLFKPLYYFSIRKFHQNRQRTTTNFTDRGTNGDLTYAINLSKSNATNNDYISSTF